MKKIIFHIGHDKTATTSIQNTFKNNAELLLGAGYLYPLPDRLSHHNRLFILLFKENLQEDENLLLSEGIDVSWIGKIEKYQRWLIQELSNTTADNIIFSAEFLPNFSVRELQKIYDFFKGVFPDVEYEVHMYTRSPVSYASSSYQQNARLSPSDEKVIYFLYKENVEKFIEVFDMRNIRLYKFEDACKYQSGPVSFLSEKLGMPECVLKRMQLYRHNDSMSDLAVDILSYINKKIPYTPLNIGKGLRRRGDASEFFSLPGNKYQMDRHVIKKGIKEAQPHVDWLKDTFDIQYSLSEKDLTTDHSLVFSESYSKKLISVLNTVNPIMRKLTYEYIQEKLSQAEFNEDNKAHIQPLLLKIKKSYPLTIKLSYGCLSAPQKLTYRLIILLKKSKRLRRLKRKLFGGKSNIRGGLKN